MKRYALFSDAIRNTVHEMRTRSRKVVRNKWQGIDVATRPDMQVYEIMHWDMIIPIKHDLDHLRRQIVPNLPWADDHFLERVCGEPLNPGVEWANWPWGKNADKFRVAPETIGDPGPDPVFDHNYMQRYWPSWAGRTHGGHMGDGYSGTRKVIALNDRTRHKGIYFPYGDLEDVIEELREDPTTRQAILPIFFPEDTGLRPGRRKPCSIFYQFILDPSHNEPQLDIVYFLRSCDLIRHFRDDIYLTVRLLLWVLEELRQRDPRWQDVQSGDFVMTIANLHCFANDMIKLRSEP